MPQQIVQLVYPALVLFFVLFALIVSDRAFPLRVRRMFYLMLLTISVELFISDVSERHILLWFPFLCLFHIHT